MKGQKLTFYAYCDGENPSRLRIGNMVWDYRNPTLEKPYVHDAEQKLKYNKPGHNELE